MLKIKPREYQKTIYNSIKHKGSTLVVLPTGLGKTLIALMAIDEIYNKGGQIFFLAPTRPLVEQHYSSIVSITDIPKQNIIMINGTIPPKKRKKLWTKKVIISTPQTVANDIANKNLCFTPALCIFDEAHRAIGKYAYTKIAIHAKKSGCLMIGLTASPGSKKKKIKEVMENLGINNIETRSKDDSDVKKYIEHTKIEWIKVELSENLKRVSNLLRTLINEKIKFFSSWGVRGRMYSKAFLIELKNKILNMKSQKKYLLLSQYAYLFNLIHLLELIETQGVNAGLIYIDKLKNRESRAAKSMFNDNRFQQALTLLENQEEHPKLSRLIKIVAKEKGQVIVFSQYVSQIKLIAENLNKKGVSNHIFIGQRKGFTQKKQKQIIEQFRSKKFKVLVSSSVGEEGLDIPSVDTVIFFEPIPSAIRSIQRRGRTGRTRAGKVIILMTKKTQDEVFYWSSKRKEMKMKNIISSFSKGSKANTMKRMKKKWKKTSNTQKNLTDFM